MHAATALTTRFQAFSTEHQLLIVFFVLGCLVFWWIGRKMRESAHERMFRIGLAVTICLFTVPMQLLQFMPSDFTLGTSLPIQVCDLAWMMAVLALITRGRRANQILYYWGFTLVIQAILTPSLQQGFPDPRWWMFWGMHFLTVWATVYLTTTRAARPSWSGYRFSVLVTLGWVGSVMLFNALTDTNYGYFNRLPPVSSPLDHLGPWPLYVLAEIAIASTVWALITWPWVQKTRRAPKESAVAA